MGLRTCACRDCEGDGEFVKHHVLRTVITKKLRESLSPARCRYKKENSLTKQKNEHCMISLWWKDQSYKTETTACCHYGEENSPTKQWILHDFIMMKRPVLQNRECILHVVIMKKRRESYQTATSAPCNYDEENSLTKQQTTASCHYDEEKGISQNRD